MFNRKKIKINFFSAKTIKANNALKDLKDAKKIHPVIRGNRLINELEKLINGENV